jgi:adenosylmethionine-8-amino-7-oxononanoate aminotransferase
VIELSFMLREFFAPDGLTRAFFTSGGSDSVETCAAARASVPQAARRGRPHQVSQPEEGLSRHPFRRRQVNGNANFRTQYEPLMPGCYHIPAPYTYRNPFNETDPAKLAQLCLAALEDEIKFQGAGHHRRLHHGAGAWRGRGHPAA